MKSFKKRLYKPAYDVIDTRKQSAEDLLARSTKAGEGERQKKTYPILPVQEIVPVKEIYRGIIITEDSRYIKILEITPINFALRSAEEQDNIIYLFSSWLRVAPSKLQFKIITRRADTREIINNVRLSTQNETQPKCLELAENYIDFIENVSGTEALSRRFFLIFEYEPTSVRQRTLDEVADEMETMAQKIRGNLAACGNEVIEQQNEDFFQAEALYLFYNKSSCAKEPFADRVVRVTEDIMSMNGLEYGVDDYPEVHISNYICPRGLDFTHPDYYMCDGMYNSILYVTREGYPTSVLGGWVAPLIEAEDGVDVDIIIHKQDRARTKEKVALKLKLNRIKANERNDNDTDFEEIEDAINSAAYIKQSLANGEDFYNLYTFITVAAETHELLTRRKEAVIEHLYSRDITTKEATLRMENAFQVVTPVLNSDDKELLDFAKRNAMTYGVASMYPFTSCELCDEKGIVLGINRRYSSLVNLDIFNTKKYKNANIAILGTSGAGKTFCTMTMALRMRMQGIQTFIIAPDKAHEFQRACVHIGGSYVRVSPGAKSCINVMEIRPVVSPIAEFLDETDSSENDSWLAQKTSQLLTFFHILISDLTNEEEQLVDEAIIKTYNRFNITHDNNSVYLPGTKTLRPMPIIGDLYETLRQNPDTKRVANILGRFVTGSASSFNQQTNVDLTNKFIVFDLQDLQGNMKAVGMFIVMDFLWSRIKENRTEKKALYIDEGWQLIGASSDTRAAEFVYRIFKIIRGYGGAAVFATQDLSDLFSFQDGKYGKAIISNSKIKIILGLEQQEAKSVQETLQLTKSELRSIINFNRGEALLCANNNKLEVFVRASKLEEELITTDPAQLREMVEKRRFLRQKELQEMQQAAADFSQGMARGASEPAPQPIDQSTQTKLTEDARMSMWRMEQLEATEVVRDETGARIETEDAPLVRVESEDSKAIEEVLISGEIFTEKQEEFSVAPDFSRDDDFDEDLDAADIASADEEYKVKGGFAYDTRPPAEF